MICFPFAGILSLGHIVAADSNEIPCGKVGIIFSCVGFFKLEPTDDRAVRRIKVGDAVDLISCCAHVKCHVVARVAGEGQTNVFKVIKADVLRRQDIRTFGILVGGGNDERVIHPRAGIHFGKLFLDLLADLQMVFLGDDRIARMVASHIVEADGNGRNVMASGCVGAFKVGAVAVDLMLSAVTVGSPMVTVGRVVAELLYIGIGARGVCALRRSKKDKAVIADLLKLLVHEFNNLARTLCAAEGLFKFAPVPNRENRLVVKTRITRIGEVIFHPIVPDVIAELFE